jgi:PTS system nitrogen regulatory IIA component
MKLIEVLRKECIVAGARCEDKASVFDVVVKTAKKCAALKDISAEEILTGLQRREALGSTGIGNHIAIPHCRLKDVSEFVMGLVTIPEGVDFKSVDGREAKVVVFIIGPEGRSNEHIRLLSAISRALMAEGAVKELVGLATSEAIYESLLRLAEADITGKKERGKRLIHVFVQDDKLFEDIFEKMSQVESMSLVAVNVESAAMYLSKMPLFADFWTDEPSKFGKVIVATVDAGLTNETLRRIESVTGDLDQRTGVMVTVTDIFYSAGMLSM